MEVGRDLVDAQDAHALLAGIAGQGDGGPGAAGECGDAGQRGKKGFEGDAQEQGTVSDAEGGQGDEVKIENRDCLRLVATGAASPSWRQTVRLEAGRYRFEVMARTAGVAATDDERGKGAGLRVSGLPKRANFIEGDAAWQALSYEFETGGGDVPLVAELRATKGEVWFLRDSFKIVRGK